MKRILKRGYLLSLEPYSYIIIKEDTLESVESFPPINKKGGSNMTGTNCELVYTQIVPVIFEPPCT
jgi:hypothetical protein